MFLHWEIIVAGFRIVPMNERKPYQPGICTMMIQLYSEDQTIVGILKFYRDVESLRGNCFLMGCVYGHFHECLSQQCIDILKTIEDVRLIYRGKTALGGRTYLQPSEKWLLTSTPDDLL